MQKRRRNEVIHILKTQSAYERFVSGIIAVSVLLVQVLLPLAPVFANEGEPATQAESSVVESTSEPEESISAVAPTESVDTPEPTQSDPSDDQISDTSTDQISDVVVEETTDSTSSSETENQSEQDTQLVNEPDESPLPEDTFVEELIEEEVTSEEDTTEETGSTTEEIIEPEPLPEEIITPVSEEILPEEDVDEEEEVFVSSTTEQTVVAPEIHTVTNDENRLSFGIDDCAQVADGSFYCRNIEEEVVVTETDRVFAGPDIDGDNEIYIEHEGSLTQLTFNLVDDSAPYYDTESESIVWHRLVDARYQIVSYDIESEEETVLTNDHYNNMQPTRADDLTVWQGWVGNDWEVLLMDDGEISMLTDNTMHDIGPRINGDYVIWQSEEADGWKVKVYNRLTKEVESIADADGASIENPRFVLLYDAKQENGDVETRGYDLESGENVPLGSVPHGIPEKIPDPDQTGEDRALIINTTQLKTKTEDDSEPDIDTTETEPATPIDSGTGTTTEDVIIPPFASDNELSVPIETEPTNSTATSSDLVIEPLIEEVPEQPVEDLVVPPYVTPTVEGVDSQDTVATSS